MVFTIKHPRKWDVLSGWDVFTRVAEVAWDVANLWDVLSRVAKKRHGMFCPRMFGTTRGSSYEHR